MFRSERANTNKDYYLTDNRRYVCMYVAMNPCMHTCMYIHTLCVVFSISTSVCHRLKQSDFQQLESSFESIISEPGAAVKLCKYLDLKTCNTLNSRNQLDAFNLAQAFIEEKPQACWEHLVELFCSRFARNKLAHDVSEKNDVDYKKYCNSS